MFFFSFRSVHFHSTDFVTNDKRYWRKCVKEEVEFGNKM